MGLLVTKQGQCQFSDLATSQYPGQLYEGIVFDDVSQFSKVNIQIQDCTHNGGVLRGCNDAYGVNMRSDANGNDGWLIADTRGLFFTNVTAYTNARYGWNLGTNGINNNTNHFYVNCVGDFSGSNNWQITHLTESVFTSSWASTQNNAAANTFAVGFYLDGTEVRDVLFNGCLALYNNSHGVRVVRATNIKFNDLIAGNTTHGNGRSGAGNGIVVEANAVNVQFNDCNSEWNTNYGYDVSPLATGIRINGGSIASNGSSQFAPGSVQSNCVVKNVSGWNPQMGAITTPSVPASGDTVTNTTGMDCSVHILSGSVSAIYVAGAYAFNQTGVVINLPAGQTIRIDYSSAPLWKWFAI
jgi:hypothetical protein